MKTYTLHLDTYEGTTFEIDFRSGDPTNDIYFMGAEVAKALAPSARYMYCTEKEE